jgi:amino acid adenylation domain-containing protein
MTCAIAIVGCAGRFPGADNVATFWKNLCAGVESIRTFDESELEDAFPPDVHRRGDFVRARGVLDRVDEFDAAFFGMHAREAELTDPQHRLFLECCWQALEDAGHDPADFRGLTGVFAGCSISSYLLRNVLADRNRIEQFTSDYQVAGYPELLGAGYDFLATRVAYKLDLRGPSMTLQSACSTSLLAVTQACQALMLRQADMMLAGGVSISFPQRRGYTYQEGGMGSGDGHCRTFDANANGTVFGDGAGVVVLRRLEDALRDGDSVYAVIRGFGVNNDGSEKVGYTAPSTSGQAAALRAAYEMAQIEPSTIGLVECHGTATPLGDPIEFAALSRTYSSAPSERKSCALGSVKSNVGHLDVASGVTGLIKAALAVRSAVIPPTLHFTSPNPHINLASSPFFVNTELVQWPIENATRRAAVSSFGVGGTNVHVVLESAPQAPSPAEAGMPQLLVISARTEASLDQSCRQLAEHLRNDDNQRLEDIAYTLQTGRRPFPARCALVASSRAEAAAALERPDRLIRSDAGAGEPVVGFLFPGQGAQYLGMGRDLYARAKSFASTIDRCAEILQPLIGGDLREILYAQTDAERLTSTDIAQPAIFAVEYALANMLREYGVVAAGAVGHSVGEFVAACLAGVFSLEDALAIVAERGRLIRALPPGVMLAIEAGERELESLLDAELDLAAVNAPNRTVVAGPEDAIARFEERLNNAGIGSRRLRTSHAFHSSMMEPALGPLAARIAAANPRAPLTPYVSSMTGDWITEQEATSPQYWAQHCRRTVRFAEALQTLVDAGVDTLVEIGPGAALSTFALAGAAKGKGARVIRTLPGSEQERPDLDVVLESLGRLWTLGAKPAWRALHADALRTRVSLPSYAFERKRHWIEPTPIVSVNGSHMRNSDSSPTEFARTEAPRVARVQSELLSILEDLSGERLDGASAQATFLELGFDSLALGRFVQTVQSRFNVNVTFRQLLGELPSVAALAEYILPQLPQETSVAPIVAAAPKAAPEAAPAGTIEALMREQLQAMQQLMREQLAALAGVGAQPQQAQPQDAQTPARGEGFRISGAPRADLTPSQRAHIDELIAQTVARTAESKRLTQRYRGVLADPRVAAGFRSEWKEMVYPITCVRAKGSRLWDVDGNEYIDLLNGFGQTAFGHAPDFVVDAVNEQLQRGFAIGPQTELAGEVAELFCELTGNERVTFCNTGSEAVMAALRVARTVTGRSRIVMFDGSYHGQFDEVLVKSARTSHRSLPVALGIPDEAVANITVLPYGTPETLQYIREHASELAAVIVESVQSRHPALRPKEFLTEIRAITQASGTAFIFDEVVTGFRMHPGGMQAVFGIRADLATYGKVVGGGLPIGILAGRAQFMDALDGGHWQYGDDSSPQVAPTFVAGTFVRHPLVMAAVLAVLRHLKAAGPALQDAISRRTERLVMRLNAELERRGISTRIETYGSLFYLNFAGEDRLASLLFYHLRLRGIYVQEGFPSFLTTEHTDADVDTIVEAFMQSLDELQRVGIMSSAVASAPPAEVALTEEQTEIWLSAQVSDEASCAFNESVTLRLRGALDESALQRALDRIVARHDALRASFGSTGETMRIASARPFSLSRSDRTLREIIDDEACTPFDLATGPLARGVLVRLETNEYALIFTAHHIICDGWSMNVILGELAELYAAYSRGEDPNLREPLAFATYALRQSQRDAADKAKTEAYWLEQFRELPPFLELPTDRPRPSIKTYEGATRTILVDRVAYNELKKGGAKYGCTLFATLLAACQLLVGRLADQDDVVVGVPTAGQSLLDDDEILVGHCVDFLPIRSRLNGAETLADFLAGVKRRVLDAYEHQQYTLGTLVRSLALPRDAGRVPLAEIQFNLERLAAPAQFGSLDANTEPNPKAFVNFDLFLNVVESEEGLRIDCDYNTDLFDASTIDRWLNYYRAILAEIARDASQNVGGLHFLPGAERRVLAELNETKADYPRQTVHELIAASLAPRGDAPAVCFEEDVVTCEALQRRVHRMANYLHSRVGMGSRVAVCIERSPDLVVTLLGTLAAGCSYVPLDAAHPPARLKRVMEDAGVAAVILDGSADRTIVPNGVETIDLREAAAAIATMSSAPPEVAVSPDDPAYVIYTSGSTGEPKGVEIVHASVVNLLTSMARKPGLGEGDVLLAVTTISFDIAALELFLPLIAGGTVAIASREELSDVAALIRRMGQSGANVVQATPSLWSALLEAGLRSYPGFKMLCGGEALSRELADQLLAGGGELWNVYGPTETTIWSSCSKIELDDEPITVGRPIANTQCYVLDRNDQPVPLGVAGHLHIGGDGVALGYVGRPELTSEKFVPNPFGSGRMYRSGDLARITSDGRVQIIGRLDHQIKLRGFRIELGEIESVVRAKTGLTEVAVALREDAHGDRRVVCYYVETPHAHYDGTSLRALVADVLPDYMVPAAWVSLERMPLSIAGKIDRKALPAPHIEAATSTYRAPATPVELTLARIWMDVLRVERVGLDDDFFSLGGDSIQLFQITARANQSGLPLKAKELLRYPALGALADFLAARENVRELEAAEYRELTAL